jgi:hypothetical protein
MKYEHEIMELIYILAKYSTFFCYNFERLVYLTLVLLFYKRKKTPKNLKNIQKDKSKNVAGSAWMSLFMDGTGKLNFLSTARSNG